MKMKSPFGGGGMNPANIQKMMDEAMQSMNKMQEEMKDLRFESSVGGGVVKAIVDGHGELKDLQIDPIAVDPSDVEMLQDLIITAVNDAAAKAKEAAASAMGGLTGGMNIPGLM
ncbi:MAG: YbaB/EbfC family nucleoid-associated protein [Armatimonadota bacterium]